MANQTFAIGAEVRLRSGGPKMTIVGLDMLTSGAFGKGYKCAWFDAQGQLHDSYFLEQTLVPALPAPRSLKYHEVRRGRLATADER